MPWHIDDDHDDCDGYAVVKDDTGDVIPGGCHDTRPEALAHLAALEIAETSQRAVDLTLPAYLSNAAKRGLEFRRDGYGGDGLVDRTIREARDMANGQITEDKIIRANAWAERHAVDLEAPQNTDPNHERWPGAGAVAHLLWGINPTNPQPARAWFARKAAAIRDERNNREEPPMDDHTEITMRRDGLSRVAPFRAATTTDGNTLDGYAAVFDEWTLIDSHEGTFRERIAPGAFRRTLDHRAPVLQFDHGTHPVIGSIPLGRITSIAEDEHGLRVRARLSDNWLVEPVRDAIRDGAITGMSFRFSVPANGDRVTRAKDGMLERTITEVALFEVGPVVFPAYEATSVGVRSRAAIDALTDPEVRSEIARILATGTDLRSLADSPDPAAGHSSDEDTDPATGHSAPATRSQAQRLALARLHLPEETHP